MGGFSDMGIVFIGACLYILIYIRIPSSGGRRDLDLGSFNVS